MGHTPSKMSSFPSPMQRLALAGAVLLPATSWTASTLIGESQCENESKTSTASAEEEEPKEDKLISILNDYLISEKILSHLTVRDLKAASQVNSKFCRMVRRSLCFQKKVILVLPKNAVGVEEILENSSLCCDEGVVDLSASSRTVQLLSEKTKEFVIRTESKTNFWLRMERMAKLLKDSPELKLKTLTVDIRELEEFSTEVSDLVEFLDVLTNFECLCISDTRVRVLKAETYVRGNGVFLKQDAVARMNLKPTSETSRSQKLTSFIYRILAYKYSHPVALEVIEEILKRHKKTLEVFCCNCNTWTLDFMKSMRIPLLVSLTVEVNAADEQVFIGFLEELENLRDLGVMVHGKLSKSLLAAIEKRSSKLTKLYMSAGDFSEVGTKDDWRFLRSMKLLNEFGFGIGVGAKESYKLGLIVMSSLPPNQLRDLSVAGVWRSLRNTELQNASCDLWMSAWKRFQCLRNLMLCCWNSIDDNSMRMILSECKQLQELMIKECPNLTIEGFTGTDNECKGIFLKDHQNLKCLAIKYCRKIQPNDLVSTDAFMNLKSFAYIPIGQPPAPIPDDIVVLFILKNPRLEWIHVPLKSDDSPERIQGIVEAWNHPLRKVTCPGRLNFGSFECV